MSGHGLGPRLGKTGSLAIVMVAYVTAVGAAWVVADVAGPDQPVPALGFGYLVSALVIYGWSLALDNGSMFDAWWSVLPPVAAVWLAGATTSAAPDGRVALVVVVVGAWAIRLTSNWARDWPGLDHEDWRYLDLYTKGPKPLISLGAVHLFPAFVVFLGSLSMVPALVWGDRPLGVLDGLAVVIGLSATAIEFVADEQMRRFAPRQGARRRDGPGAVALLTTPQLLRRDPLLVVLVAVRGRVRPRLVVDRDRTGGDARDVPHRVHPDARRAQPGPTPRIRRVRGSHPGAPPLADPSGTGELTVIGP